jgi:L,D-transpeptidase ErfK/SrfK
MPGVLVGNINPYVVKRGDTLAWIAARFGVHPLHVSKPSAKELRHGMSRGDKIWIDQRRVQPSFKADVSGVVLNLPEAEVYLVDKGTLVRAYPVGVSNADWKAPIGDTRIVDMERHPTWYVPKRIQAEMKQRGIEVIEKMDPGPSNPLGARWIGWSDGSYGFHGTTVPTSIKHYASHGCVRFLREDIIDLYDRVHVGMPVHVIYQPVTLAVDRKTVWLSVYPDYYNLGFDFKGAIKALAYQAGVLDRVQWKMVDAALREKDGTVMPIAKPIEPPHPPATPKPSVKPSMKPSTTPSAAASGPAPSTAPATANPSVTPPTAKPAAPTPAPVTVPSGTNPPLTPTSAATNPPAPAASH